MLPSQIVAAPGAPSSVRVGTVTGVGPLAVTVQGTVFQPEGVGVVGGYVPTVGDVVCLLGQSTTARSDPASWLLFGPVRPATTATEWLALGTSAAPYAANWANVGAPFRAGAYRRTADGCVELAGLIAFTGTIAAPATMFTLPAGFVPVGGNVQPNWTVSNNPAAGTAPVARGMAILTSGVVQVTHYAGVVNPGPISLDGVRFSISTI